MLGERIEHFRATWKKGSMSPLMYRDANEIIAQLEAEVAGLREYKLADDIEAENQRLREIETAARDVLDGDLLDIASARLRKALENAT